MRKKVIASILLMIFISEIFTPSISLALTSGPDQPEFSSFTPASLDNMVDPFTGDFSYNLPLFNVPGYKEGYPVNLSYQSGISPEQEASWVGLGWNLNPGVVSRNMRGIPDEFSGEYDSVTKKKNIKDNVTFTGGAAFASEALGGNIEWNAGLVMSLNNYTGISTKVEGGINLSLQNSKALEPQFGLNIVSGADNGLSLTPSVGLSTKAKEIRNGREFSYAGSFSMTLNSNVGVKQIGFNIDRKIDNYSTKTRSFFKPVGSASIPGLSLSFANSAPVPFSDFPRNTVTTSGRGEVGLALFGLTGDVPMHFTSVRSFLTEETISYGAYGYLNSHKYQKGENLMDFQRLNDVQATGNSKVISIPQATPDLFSITSQEFSANVRAYRKDIGIYKDPVVVSKGIGNTFGVEPDFDSAPGFKYSGNFNSDYSESYSGPFQDDHDDYVHQNFDFLSGSIQDILNGNKAIQSKNNDFTELYYFASDDEFTADLNFSNQSSSIQHSENALAVAVGSAYYPSRASTQPSSGRKLVSDEGTTSYITSFEGHTKHRKPRKKIFQFLPTCLFSPDPQNDFLAPRNKPNHIKQVRATLEDGTIYMYGENLYILESKEVVFSVDETTGNPKYIQYGVNDNSTTNDKGQENFYSETTITPYPSKFLLTKIVTDDYVDYGTIGANPLDPALDNADMGEWVKFDYQTPIVHSFRSPYGDPNSVGASTNPSQRSANYSSGFKSHPLDDKGSYTYGKKEVTYLKSIKTKTHRAEFVTADRYDNRPTLDENGGLDDTNPSQLLKAIKLYKLGDDPNSTLDDILLKTVKFIYDYSLCKNVTNYKSGNNDQAEYYDFGDHSKNGKLTLLRVEIFDGKNETLTSKYSFDYNKYNPNNTVVADSRFTYLDGNCVDRWGTYQTKRFDGEQEYLHEFPYTNQYSSYDRDTYASAFSLKRIHLPTGGSINIDYESDSYRFVENKVAQSMYEIVGFASSDQLSYISNDISSLLNVPIINHERNYIIVKLPGNPSSSFKASDLIKDVNKLFFKVYFDLIYKNGPQRDYIEGYADIEGVHTNSTSDPNGWYTDGNSGGAKFAVVKIKNTSLNNGTGEAHAFRKAAWQHLRYRRADLFQDLSTIDNINGFQAAVSVFPAITSIFIEGKKLLQGYYRYARSKYAKRVSFPHQTSGHNYPSMVKLNSLNDIKYGGGLRVKQIWLDDNWNDLSGIDHSSHVLGSRYHYVDYDGNSSGVACYEPMVGSEEIAHKSPLKYGSDEKFKSRDNAFYVEDPVMEGFYPAPSVGYARVIIQPIGEFGNLITTSEIDDYYINKQTYAASDFEKVRNPITVKEFHTSKEFPIISKRTKLISHSYEPTPLVIPLVGSKTVTQKFHSQGFMVITNDMHGKLQKESVLPYTSNIDELNSSTATNVIEYEYAIEGGFQDNMTNQLTSDVDFIQSSDWETSPNYQNSGPIGIDSEFYAAERESHQFSKSDAVILNSHVFNAAPIPSMVPVPVPSFSRNENLYKEFSTIKVIRKKGILLRKIQTVNQSRSIQENIKFDGNTGTPLVTSISNSYDDPVYEYNFPGHHYYKGLAPKYKNVDKKLRIIPLEDTSIIDWLASYYYYSNNSFSNWTSVSFNGLQDYKNFLNEELNYPDDVLTPGDFVVLSGKDYNENQTPVIQEFIKYLWVVEDNSGSGSSWKLVDEAGGDYSYSIDHSASTLTSSSSSPTAQQQSAFRERMVEMDNFIQVITPAEKNKLGEQVGYIKTLSPKNPAYQIPIDIDDYNTATRRVPTGSFHDDYIFDPYITITDCSGNEIEVSFLLEAQRIYIESCDASIVFPANLPSNFRYYNIASINKDLITFYDPNSPSSQVTGQWADVGKCFECDNNVLSAWAKTFEEDWNYLVDNPNEEAFGYFDPNRNEYSNGKKGRWLMKENYVFRNIARNQFPHTPSTPSLINGNEIQADLRRDGIYENFVFFPWNAPSSAVSNWIQKDEITEMDASGRPIELLNALEVSSSVLYGYDNKLPIATCSNCESLEFGFDSFEDIPISGGLYDYSASASNISGRGRILLNNSNGLYATTSEKHSGQKSLVLPSGTSTTLNLSNSNTNSRTIELQSGKDYILSFWYKSDASAISTGSFNIVSGSVNYSLSDIQEFHSESIDEWVRVQVILNNPTSISINAPVGNNAYLDDIRIQPLVSSMTSYIYDPVDYKVITILDERNFATFYKYNDRNDLVNINKETKKGIYTLKSGYKNTINTAF